MYPIFFTCLQEGIAPTYLSQGSSDLQIESVNHRMVEVRRDLWRLFGPKQGHLKQAAQDHEQMEYLQGRRLHNLYG